MTCLSDVRWLSRVLWPPSLSMRVGIRAGETELGVTMSVIPWVACNPSTSSPADDNAANRTKKPLFLFLEGIDVNSPGGGHSTIVPRSGGVASGAPVAGSMRRGKERGERSSLGRRRSDGSVFSSSSSGTPPPPPPPPSPRPLRSPSGSSLGPRATRRASAPSTGSPAAALLSHRPLEVVVYASLSFRNLLPVEVGWRVVGARGDAGAKVAEGKLGPGEGVHVLEANAMAMTPSLSFKVPTYVFFTPGFLFFFPLNPWFYRRTQAFFSCIRWQIFTSFHRGTQRIPDTVLITWGAVTLRSGYGNAGMVKSV